MRIRPDIARQAISSSKEMAISLSGCGFLGTYHMGVATCFFTRGEILMSRIQRIGGASAGSLVAALLLLNPQKLESGLNTIYTMAEELHSLRYGALTPGYQLQDRLIQVVDAHIPEDISRAQGRLIVSLTNYKTRENLQVTKYRNREHLLECLMASCYIPGYSKGFYADPPLIDGHAFFDGFYSNNLPEWEDIRTITVSPFSGNADVAPEDPPPWTYPWAVDFGKHLIRVNYRNLLRGSHALFPPSVPTLRRYYDLGYKDALKFLKINKLLDEKIIEKIEEKKETKKSTNF